MMSLYNIKPALKTLGILKNNFVGFFFPFALLFSVLFSVFHSLLFYFCISSNMCGTKGKLETTHNKKKHHNSITQKSALGSYFHTFLYMLFVHIYVYINKTGDNTSIAL